MPLLFMKNLLLCFILLAGFQLVTAQNAPGAAAFNIMTFNIRYPNPDDGFNFWVHRKEMVASMVHYHDADIVGVQEAFRSQLDDLSKLMPGYEWFGLCRTDSTTNPSPDNEFSAIFYRKDRFERLDGNTFWLSETPDVPGKKGWDADLPRIVTWIKFKDKRTGKTFFHFNTHFDHRGQKARQESAKLVMQKIKTIAGGNPIVFTGDFNARPTDDPIRILTDKQQPDHFLDGYLITQTPHHGPTGTSTNGFLFPGVQDSRIDYIFVKNKMAVLKHAILSDSWSGRLPSDHLPVIARVRVD